MVTHVSGVNTPHTIDNIVNVGLESVMQSSGRTPVLAKQLGYGLPILQAIRASKDSVEALVVVHIGAGNGGPCLAGVERMTLQQPHPR